MSCIWMHNKFRSNVCLKYIRNIAVADLIGEGSFSQVFKGQYQGAEVAVKRLRTPLCLQDRTYFASEV